MSILKGSEEISAAALGVDELGAVYLGTEEVWSPGGGGFVMFDDPFPRGPDLWDANGEVRGNGALRVEEQSFNTGQSKTVLNYVVPDTAAAYDVVCNITDSKDSDEVILQIKDPSNSIIWDTGSFSGTGPHNFVTPAGTFAGVPEVYLNLLCVYTAEFGWFDFGTISVIKQ